MSDDDFSPPALRSSRSTGSARLTDVARVAGVAPMTVSRALNRPELVSEATRLKVQRAVLETGYVPNRVAGALASSRSRLVALLVPTVAHSLFAEVTQTIMAALAPQGYQVMLGLVGYTPEQEEKILETVLSRRPDGIVLTGCRHSELARRRLLAAEVPLVEIWDMTDEPLDMLVGFSHEAVGEAVGRHLVELGRRRIGVISADDSRARRRVAGLAAVLHATPDASMTVREVGTPSSMPWGREKSAELLDNEAVDAIVCSSDILAMGVLAEAQSRGVDVPGALAIMGFGDSSYAKATFPALSTVRIDGATLGRRAAEHLLARMAQPHFQRVEQTLDLGFEIVDRGTT
ncbi:LacI family DNA-binding transcriptional regulator [Salinicola rhizosphaerae]|uniref:LacI family transcriptional regulator n=1 Tax=Salinicola rhizosphaerae TaxID=1443141 RepID=A0ABQ3E8F4_9GAMM|nr:LacI family DNA-binding transcriptional regulator [Salinicola rhizosphaerae]GHB29822.1 LacI family transcriptional regulator [Salinicola rhizosphaerae]